MSTCVIADKPVDDLGRILHLILLPLLVLPLLLPVVPVPRPLLGPFLASPLVSADFDTPAHTQTCTGIDFGTRTD